MLSALRRTIRSLLPRLTLVGLLAVVCGSSGVVPIALADSAYVECERQEDDSEEKTEEFSAHPGVTPRRSPIGRLAAPATVRPGETTSLEPFGPAGNSCGSSSPATNRFEQAPVPLRC